MRKVTVVSVVASLLLLFCLLPIPRGAGSAEAAPPHGQYQDSSYYEPYTPEQLDNLLAPIALYPDPLLAQVLVAATFPDQIQDAAQWIRSNNLNDIDYQPWDVSVKAVAHYATVLEMLNNTLDWTTALGQAYVNQSTDVMMSVQHLRTLAYSEGNLITTPEQQVIRDRGYIEIVPAQPRVIYVPEYDPGVIYVRRVYRPGVGFGGFFNFGTGFGIGAWLNYDLDWDSRRVIYDDWGGHGGGWRERSRPYVRVTDVYVNNRYQNVNVNRNVVERHVDYDNVKRYNSVHRDVTYENRAAVESNRGRNGTPGGAGQPRSQPPNNRGIGNQPPAVRPDQPARTAPPENQPGSQPPNGRTNDRGFGKQPPAARPEQPTRTAPPENQPGSQPPNGRTNDRGFGNQPPAARPEQPTRTAPPENQPGSQPPNGRTNDRGFGNQPPAARSEQPTRTAPPENQPGSQPPNGRANDQGNRNQPPAVRPEQPTRTAPPENQPRPQPPNGRANDQGRNQQPPARPEQPATTASPENQRKGQQQQQQQRDDKNKGKGKDNGKDNGGNGK